jgi:nitroimidazol reductase NimA-like FMN-containing flavoprotein (pyridoxamine 5'-phosphate oxidase superfamily)
MIDTMKRLTREQDVCVLATASENRPHCSLMAYVTDSDCREVYMVTHRGTTKYRNMMENPLVSLLIDTREEQSADQRPSAKALTVEGTFERIEDGTRQKDIQDSLVKRHPHLRGFMGHPDAEVFAVRIRSFLLLDGLTDAHFQTV